MLVWNCIQRLVLSHEIGAACTLRVVVGIRDLVVRTNACFLIKRFVLFCRICSTGLWPFHSYWHVAHSKINHRLASISRILHHVSIDLISLVSTSFLLTHVPSHRSIRIIFVHPSHDHLTATMRCDCLTKLRAPFAVLSFR